ncbi:hypothetical protein [Butyrivibrio sp. LC3010]|uniref:hypothetical protein n=1 Tax=Butyrivibrio sp. LC3010 TaxID=1280680 RepID=UPI0004030ECD|nr:hypothetical protein [Butyrivibrio sp. LC3010]
MLILTFIILVIVILITLVAYLYINDCMRLQRRLLKLGVSKSELLSFRDRFSVIHLKELLYEKETELAEECFLTVEKDI